MRDDSQVEEHPDCEFYEISGDIFARARIADEEEFLIDGTLYDPAEFWREYYGPKPEPILTDEQLFLEAMGLDPSKSWDQHFAEAMGWDEFYFDGTDVSLADLDMR